MKNLIEISLVQFIANYLIANEYESNTTRYINYQELIVLATLYEQEHSDSLVACKHDDEIWTRTVSEDTIRKEGNVFYCRCNMNSFLMNYYDVELTKWFRDKSNLSIHKIYDLIDCSYILDMNYNYSVDY